MKNKVVNVASVSIGYISWLDLGWTSDFVS